VRFLPIPRGFSAARVKIAAVALLAIFAVFCLRSAHIAAQDFPAVLGRIEGDDLEVVTKTPAGMETDAAPTVVASGSDVTLHSGRALLLLNGGGEISICGPAHFKMVKSSGSLTLALDYGRVHSSLDSADAFTIYTPTIVATPIAISAGPRDTTLGLDPSGEMCILTARGAMRVETQFSDQSMIIPQGGTASLTEGQIVSLRADASACSCEFPRARLESPKPAPPTQSQPQPNREVGTLARPLPQERKRSEITQPPSAPAGEPVYTVLMPPLSFDSKSAEPPPDPAPETIALVREVRLRPTVEFHGHVNPAPSQPAAPPSPPSAPTPPSDARPKPQPGILDRVRSFFRRLTSANRASREDAACNA